MVEPTGVENPERAGGGGCELDEQGECELSGAGRRKLRELLARERAPEDREGRSFGRQPELVGRSGDRDPCLAGLEAVLDRDRDDRVAEEVERSALTPAVGQPPRSRLAGHERGAQVRWKWRGLGGPWIPAPIAAARAISSEASVAPTGDDLRSAAASTVSTVPFCVQ